MDKDALLNVTCPLDTVIIPLGVAEDGTPLQGQIGIRGLRREEYFNFAKISGKDGDLEQLTRGQAYAVAQGMIDPVMTYDEALQWIRQAPNTVTGPVIEGIMNLSGLREGAPKEAYKSLRKGRRARI